MHALLYLPCSVYISTPMNKYIHNINNFSVLQFSDFMITFLSTITLNRQVGLVEAFIILADGLVFVIKHIHLRLVGGI